MSKLSMQAYKSLIDGDLQIIDEFLPKNSLEKSHIKSLLINSVEQNYQCENSPFNILEIQSLIVLVDEKIHKTSTGRNYFHYKESLKKTLKKLENIQNELLKV